MRDLSTSIPWPPYPGAGPAPSASLPDEYLDTWGGLDSGLRTILTQAAGAVWPTPAGPPAAELNATLSFGQDLVLRTAGLAETRLLIDTV